jgi:hypothetical protein
MVLWSESLELDVLAQQELNIVENAREVEHGRSFLVPVAATEHTVVRMTAQV